MTKASSSQPLCFCVWKLSSLHNRSENSSVCHCRRHRQTKCFKFGRLAALFLDLDTAYKVGEDHGWLWVYEIGQSNSSVPQFFSLHLLRLFLIQTQRLACQINTNTAVVFLLWTVLRLWWVTFMFSYKESLAKKFGANCSHASHVWDVISATNCSCVVCSL